MSPVSPVNQKVICYLTRDGRTRVPVAAPDSVSDPHLRLGSHTDIVSRIWDELGSGLPVAARTIFYGTPALVHPASGIVFALGLGTQYGLRLPAGMADAAVRAGARTFTRWSTGDVMDTRRDLGDDWVFGAWLADESDWCKRAFDCYGPA